MQPSAKSDDRPVTELGGVVPLHALTYLDEDGEVTVGCAVADSYAVLPADGAALLRQLEDGVPADLATQWYQQTYGEPVDMAEFLAALVELGFVRDAEEEVAPVRPPRWAWLGRAIFCPAGALAFVALMVTWLVFLARFPQLLPERHDIFFSKYLSLVVIVSVAGQLPLVLLHELFHVLAGRRLGLRTKLSVGRRLYYIVFQTEMDGLASVPRRQRYVPILAGMVCDLGVIAILGLVAALTMEPGDRLSLTGRIALAVAYATLLRVLWQFMLYLETDLYYLISTVLGCVNLQATARAMLRGRMRALLRRDGQPVDLTAWHPRDRRVARWYSWLLLAGWTFSLVILVAVALPLTAHAFALASGRLVHWSVTPVAERTDSLIFFFAIAIEVGSLLWLARRDRRNRRIAKHTLS